MVREMTSPRQGFSLMTFPEAYGLGLVALGVGAVPACLALKVAPQVAWSLMLLSPILPGSVVLAVAVSMLLKRRDRTLSTASLSLVSGSFGLITVVVFVAYDYLYEVVLSDLGLPYWIRSLLRELGLRIDIGATWHEVVVVPVAVTTLVVGALVAVVRFRRGLVDGWRWLLPCGGLASLLAAEAGLFGEATGIVLLVDTVPLMLSCAVCWLLVNRLQRRGC